MNDIEAGRSPACRPASVVAGMCSVCDRAQVALHQPVGQRGPYCWRCCPVCAPPQTWREAERDRRPLRPPWSGAKRRRGPFGYASGSGAVLAHVGPPTEEGVRADRAAAGAGGGTWARTSRRQIVAPNFQVLPRIANRRYKK